MRTIVAIALVFCLSSCEEKVPQWQKTQLISVEELKAVFDEEEIAIRLIDVRPKEKFSEGHLPKAANLWRPQMESISYPYRGMMASGQEMQELFQELGITNDDWCVLYDASGQVNAARLWWILDAYGYRNVALLDGGIQAWKRAGLELESGVQKEWTKSGFKLSTVRDNKYWASKEEISDGIQEFQLIDCRSVEEYEGSLMKGGAYRAGHIPNAIHIDFSECIHKSGDKDCTFRSIEQLKEMYRLKGIRPEKPVVVYCHSGVRSAHSTFVLTRLLGYQQVRNYDGSWIEWSYYPELPVETGSPKVGYQSN